MGAVYLTVKGVDKFLVEKNEFTYTINGLKNDTVKKKLTALFPKDYVPSDIFEWNCLYQVFSKKLK